MKLVVQATPSLTGECMAPSSKSHSVRALFFALLGSGESRLENMLAADDVRDTLAICRQFAIGITQDKNTYVLESPGLPAALSLPSMSASPVIHTGNSGIATHFILPLLGLRQSAAQPVHVTCNRQMSLRPVAPLVSALRALGLQIHYLHREGFLPLTIAQRLAGGKAEISGITSQYLSALLIALPGARNDSEITTHHLRERPYLEMTLAWLTLQNIAYTHHSSGSTDTFYVPGRQRYPAVRKTITGDFSSASYLIAAAAMTQSEVTMSGLDMQDCQADKQLIGILQAMGAQIQIDGVRHKIHVQGGKPLNGITIDASDFPDLLPTLAVLGSHAQGCTQITNVPQARLKETDRIHAIAVGLKKMGCRLTTKPDGITIYQSPLRGARVTGFGDHRTVMALCVAGLIAQGTTVITGAQAINKTYPSFSKDMQSLGAMVRVVPESESADDGCIGDYPCLS